MKREYGTGVSTKIIFFNDTPEDMFYSGSDSWSGRWQVSPPEKVKHDIKTIALLIAEFNFD